LEEVDTLLQDLRKTAIIDNRDMNTSESEAIQSNDQSEQSDQQIS